jgi:hypothetical protein
MSRIKVLPAVHKCTFYSVFSAVGTFKKKILFASIFYLKLKIRPDFRQFISGFRGTGILFVSARIDKMPEIWPTEYPVESIFGFFGFSTFNN